MKQRSTQVAICGSGLAGLAAAIECQKLNLDYLLIEKDSNVGGKCKTDVIDGFICDHGFQVLLTNYDMAKYFLNYDDLNFSVFPAGAKMMTQDGPRYLYHPFKHPVLFLSSLLSSPCTFSDSCKLLPYLINTCLISDQSLFSTKEVSIQQLFNDLNCSSKLKSSFLIPFFRGIFCDYNGITSSRLCQYYLKQFIYGQTVIPEKGIAAIPMQMSSFLKQQSILTNTKIKQIAKNKVVTSQGSIHADYVISTLDRNSLSHCYGVEPISYNQVSCYYFVSDERPLSSSILHLNGNLNSIINNFYCPTLLNPNASPRNKYLISCSIIPKDSCYAEYSPADILSQAKPLFGNQVEKWKYLTHYDIPFAQPTQKSASYSYLTKYNQEGLYFAGDWTVQGSIQGALSSGKRAVEQISKQIKS